MLFELNGYFDLVIYNNDSIRYIILYFNNFFCNEVNYCCISKMYNFLIMYLYVIFSIYFFQLYYIEIEFFVLVWNCEVFWSLVSLWLQVILSLISGGIWYFFFNNFVSGVLGLIVFQFILFGRVLVDRYNVYEINVIIGVKFYFIDIFFQTKEIQNIKVLGSDFLNNVFFGQFF